MGSAPDERRKRGDERAAIGLVSVAKPSEINYSLIAPNGSPFQALLLRHTSRGLFSLSRNLGFEMKGANGHLHPLGQTRLRCGDIGLSLPSEDWLTPVACPGSNSRPRRVPPARMRVRGRIGKTVRIRCGTAAVIGQEPGPLCHCLKAGRRSGGRHEP